uniref:Uncharacterized protein n=1 Tax=Rhizophora mucronata TaxID=61149 RepID=A0A2P2R4E1_RHIMU
MKLKFVVVTAISNYMLNMTSKSLV